MPLTIDFSGGTVIVSGGNRGIGAAIAETFAETGANIALLYNTGENEASAHATSLQQKYKVTVRSYQCDTTNAARSAEVIAQAAKDFGRLDVLVCNAGVCKHIDAIDTTEEIVDWTLGVNVKGVFFLCQAIAKHWISLKQPGSIVVNSSMSGHIINTPQRQAIYNASKSAATQLVKAFAFEWAEHGIRVNAVSPGYVKTEMTAMGNQDMQKVWLDRTPIGRMANPAEIGKSIAFLASGLSTYTTGSELLVDGGYSIL
ncbi:Sorbose reductase SOU1 OS=Candida albicans (strain SC5314 / ATCC MYA-2876) GN=SOU1 PE=1 SV=1 [Rhizoctonia solani AG-1 IB]|uniref:Sorbose reductase SOU1 n=1 Tax=Thanatephorus cucumeris (strain AG1-IB / isolate 7/3/14) TaxID=1108050 RepID=A0A0B7FY96_THACB|nr:Sorbose reductase SOU1 OS=Candida albicans (strain SC5314 / ATCC MYA-2876) GN=SOU1 PE=1 SV=1 [Rhizoctonia solani AG-1 IB]